MPGEIKDNAFLRQACPIDGRWLDGDREGRKPIAVENPATGRLIGHVPSCGAVETDAAIAAAQRALPAWRALPAATRAGYLEKMGDLMLAHIDELAALLTAEQGKPLAEAAGEIRYAASFLHWFAGEAVRVRGETIPAARADQRIVVTRQPVGVCGLITPWNFPSAMLARKLAPALAAGCTVVAKPAEETPFSALAFGVLAEQVGLPPGVLNLVTGPAAPIGKAMLASPLVRKISFTGSTEVGKQLLRGAADTVKRVTMELGGNAPFLVFADADLERAATGAMASKYRASGQTCVCANRFLVERSVAEAFAAELVARSRALVVGDGAAPGTQIGPLINSKAVEKVRRLVGDALERGATLLAGAMPDNRSLFCQPVVLAGVSGDMAIWREEIFGPVVALRSFEGEAEAIALANDTAAGLVAYLYTRDPGRIVRVTEALAYGMVGVNEGIVSYAQGPFGGIKESGLGREGSHHGIEEYLDLKYVLTTL
jgi:succinate-semialdehyde dehydrogenase/glutarate-semialdehyde dehydrogenase